MSFLNQLFGTKADPAPAAPAATNNSGGNNSGATQQQNGAGGLPANPLPTNAPNGGDTNIQAAGDGNNASVSPLDVFKDIWKNDANATNKNEPLSFNVDPQKLMEAASKVDFSKAIKPEHLQAIIAGGEGAATAFAQAINSVAQTTYAQNAAASAKIVEAALAQAEDKFKMSLPDLIKRQNVSNSLREENPLLSHEAAAPVLAALEDRLTTKFPNATASEITDRAKEYLKAFAEIASPKKPDTTTTNKKDETDWSTFLM